jgi:hypothetical protein
MSVKKQFSREITDNIGDYAKVKIIINNYLKTNDITTFSLFGDAFNYRNLLDKIVVLCNIFQPVRRIAKIIKAPESIAVDGIHEDLKYAFISLLVNDDIGSIIYDEDNHIIFDERKPVNLITKRRGCWLVGEILFSEKDIVYYYEKYVRKMMHLPRDYEKTKVYFEQYDWNYPELGWTQGIKKKRKSRKKEDPQKKAEEEQIVEVEPMVDLVRQKTNSFAREDDFWKQLYGETFDVELLNNVDNLDIPEVISIDSENDNTVYDAWVNDYYDNKNKFDS